MFCSIDDVFQWGNLSDGSFLDNGMTYSNGIITVPKDGLYYIYAQVLCSPGGFSTWCGYTINVNGFSISNHYFNPLAQTGDESVVGGLLRKLNTGDELSVNAHVTGIYYLDLRSYFGAFFLS